MITKVTLTKKTRENMIWETASMVQLRCILGRSKPEIKCKANIGRRLHALLRKCFELRKITQFEEKHLHLQIKEGKNSIKNQLPSSAPSQIWKSLSLKLPPSLCENPLAKLSQRTWILNPRRCRDQEKLRKVLYHPMWLLWNRKGARLSLCKHLLICEPPLRKSKV